MPAIYAYTRRLNPATGDVMFDDTISSWTRGHPAGEVILRCVRTPLGTALRDPAYGLDLEGIDPKKASATSEVERRIRRALDRYVKIGLFTIIGVAVEFQGVAIVAKIEFKDPRDVSGDVQRVQVQL